MSQPSRVLHLDVEVRYDELLAPTLRWFFMAYDRTFLCLEANYPLCLKEPVRSVPKPLVGGFGFPSWFFMAYQKRAGVATV